MTIKSRAGEAEPHVVGPLEPEPPGKKTGAKTLKKKSGARAAAPVSTPRR